MKTSYLVNRLFFISGFAALSACGGGTDGTGVATGPTTQMTSSGVMTRGSVILNGTRFDDTAAVITDDRNRTAAQLATGMVVRVRGRSDDGVNGKAERVEIENEARGAIDLLDDTANPRRVRVNGLTMLVDDSTVFANAAHFAALALADRIEVHGLRDAAGLVRASRIEKVEGAGADELRGAVSNLDTNANTFTLNGNVVVHYTNAVFAPVGTNEANLAIGAVVEVRGSMVGSTFTATQVDIEDLEDDSFLGSANEKQEVEGFVSGFSALSKTFKVNGRTVRVGSGARFEGGTSADLVDNTRIEAEGVIDATGVLVASKVQFRRTRVILQGLATAVNAAARTLVVLGQTVQANDLTKIDTRGGNGNRTDLSNIAPNIDCVEVRASMDGTTIVADEIIEPGSCPSDNRSVVQARLSAQDGAGFTLTFFNAPQLLTIAVPNNGATLRDTSGALLTRTQFFSSVVAAGSGNLGTLIKVRAQAGGGTYTAEEAELVSAN